MARGVIARSLSQLGLGLVTGTFVALSASPAQAIFYSGVGAESYAHTYAMESIVAIRITTASTLIVRILFPKRCMKVEA
jgi:hypothetical protein